MDFRVLGPLEVRTDGSEGVRISRPKVRALLAMLLINADAVVGVDDLVEELWGARPPRTARGNLKTYVWQLRGLLAGPPAGPTAAGRVRTCAGGYQVRVAGDELDTLRFERLAAEGRRALRGGEPRAAADRLGEALALWRGRALADVPLGHALEATATRLEERRLDALEDLVDARLALGEHGEVVDTLRTLVADQPLRERLWEQLIVALYRAGRRADALAAFRDLRRLLVDELGVEPGSALQRLHQQVLAGDPALLAPMGSGPERDRPRAGRAGTEPLRQLPPATASFTGRVAELAELDRVLAATGQAGSPAIVAIHGTAGAGKSALAVHAAHRLAGRFPDGQLYVNLQAATAGLAPLAPLEVLGRFLRALGVPGGDVPAAQEEAAARFRSEVAGRRLLIVLDNARDSGQVAPLLPGSAACAVLVTSRRLLAGLDGAHHLLLDVLPAPEAVALLGRLAGRGRVAGEPLAAGEVAGRCGYLPLALRVAGARLAARPGWPLRALVERLADAEHRLDELEVGGVGVRASFAVSVAELGGGGDPLDRLAAVGFGLLGLLDGPEIAVPVAARLWDVAEHRAGQVLERLVDAHLLEGWAPGRYRLHDLLRLYAREHAAHTQPEPARAAALTRAFGFYVATAWRTLALLRLGDHRLARADARWTGGGLELGDAAAALAWLELERANLLAVVTQAASTPGVPDAMAVQLAHALFGYFQLRSYWRDELHANQTALAVARRLDDRAAEAQVHSDLGIAHEALGDYTLALACYEQSLAIFRALGDRFGEAVCLGNLGVLQERQGRNAVALAFHEQSLAIFRALGHRRGQAVCSNNLGIVYERQERYDDALACHETALAVFQKLGEGHGQAMSLGNLGIIHERQGRYDQALACHERSLAIRQEIGYRWGQAVSLRNLGVLHQRQGRYDQALACHERSLAIRQEVGDRRGQAESRRELGVTLQALGRHAEARAHWQQALATFEQLQSTDADTVRALLADRPADLLAEQPADEPADRLADEPADRLADLLADEPPDRPADRPAAPTTRQPA